MIKHKAWVQDYDEIDFDGVDNPKQKEHHKQKEQAGLFFKEFAECS